jgi:hypothetical protein
MVHVKAKSRLGALVSILVVELAVPVRAAAAPTKEQCFDAYERAQSEQKQGKLMAARTDYETCSDVACPKLVVKDCASAFGALKAGVPSVSIGSGGESGVRVSIDGADAVEIPSSAVELDPGDHVFRFQAGDGRVSEQHKTLEKGQLDVSVVPEFENPGAASAPPASTEAPSPEPESPSKKSNVLPYVLGGVALIGVAGFVGFGLAGKSKQSDLDACKPDCQPDDVHSMRQKYLFADISLGVALVAGGIGTYLYLSGNKTSERAIWVRPSAGPGTATLELGSRF